MKTLTNIILTSILATSFFGCKKDSQPSASIVASLSFVNATIGSSPVIVSIGKPHTIYSAVTFANELSYGSSNLFSPPSGNTAVAVYQSTDTTNTLFNGHLNLQNHNNYSLYLAGTVIHPDTVFIHENLPRYAQTDSTTGIRFINLSQNGGPVSVDVQGQSNGSEVESLTYKGSTTFKRYKANSTISSYVFEFRDVTTGDLLATYELDGVNNSTGTDTEVNTVRFNNQTIALIGGGTVSTSAILIPNY